MARNESKRPFDPETVSLVQFASVLASLREKQAFVAQELAELVPVFERRALAEAEFDGETIGGYAPLPVHIAEWRTKHNITAEPPQVIGKQD